MMEFNQELGNDDFQLTANQLKVKRKANRLIYSVSADSDTAALIEAELRRSVYETIVQLSEIVSERGLKMLLPFLHCAAWDEVVEERFLGNPHLCGFPTCSEVVEMRKKRQRYHIDRQARKIYENRIESDMYCSRLCMLRSASVRSQLADEPLWLTCNIEGRLCSSYCIDIPLEVTDVSSKKVDVEVVRASEEKISDLLIREAESSATSEAEEEEEREMDVEEYLVGVEKDITSLKEEEKELNHATDQCESVIGGDDVEQAMKTIKLGRNTTHRSKRRVKNEDNAPPRNPRLPDPQFSANPLLTRLEEEKLSRLRSKYWGRVTRKPIVIEPLPATASRTDLRVFVCEHDHQGQQRPAVDTDKSICSDIEKTVKHVEELFRYRRSFK